MAGAVWLKRPMQENNSSAIYLAALAICDLLFLVLHIPQELMYAWGYSWRILFGQCGLYLAIMMTLQYLSPILVLAFTVERYIAVCHPYNHVHFCTCMTMYTHDHTCV